MSEPRLPLTDSELDLAFREGATDGEIEAKLRHLFFWSYIMRDPFGRVCAVGKGTRADCVREALRHADEYASESFPLVEKPEDQYRCLNGAWRLVLWPPILDADPAFWPDYDLLWE
jgi:hypothetical protein